MKRKVDIWTSATIILAVIFAIFLIYPLFGVLQQSVIAEDGPFTLEQFKTFFTNPYYDYYTYTGSAICLFLFFL